MKRQPTIGLEIHAILKTRTKMFCDSPNVPEDREPNRNVCPVCLGHPGALPTINEEAVRQVIRVGLALGGKINPISKFDRKNYFYPDLPKGYQISQYDQPLVTGGELCGVRITRIHLEEDAGRLLHEIPGSKKGEATYVDFNRAGVPLMELVTEPDVRSAEQTLEFARELQRILRYLGASDADMEKGQMRVEANVSLDMGVKTELKNINSFRAVSSAVAYEIERQGSALDGGEKIVQETRGWDEGKQRTFSQRSKEEAHDYRYFPEPDLPPFETARFGLEELRAGLPELPSAKRERFVREFGLSSEKAAQLVEDKAWAEFFEEAVSELATRDELTTSTIEKKPRDLLFNYFMSDLLGSLNERGVLFADSKVTPEHLAHLVDLIADGKIMSRQAKDILRKMVETGSDPEEIMKDEGLQTISDSGEIEIAVREIISENSAAVADFKKGKSASLQFLIGKAMGRLRGRANPAELKHIFERELK